MCTHAGGIDEKSAATYLGSFGLAFMLGRFAGTFLMKYIKPVKLLALYAGICIALCLVAILAKGSIIIYTLIAIAFFMSIMFPTIFSMGIEGLGHNTKIGSSLIIMSIVGGAVLPPLLGYISDTTKNIQYGYIVPLVSFIVIALFAANNHKPTAVNEKIELV
jgi:FHS family L-fucose permease-like MFS transporter